MAQTSYLNFNHDLVFSQGRSFTAYRSVTTRSREGLMPPIAILDDPMYDDSSDEFDSDDERSIFSRHKHRLLVERARAPSPEDLHYSKKGKLCLQLPLTPIPIKKSSKGYHQIDTSMKWDYSNGPLSPLSGISESDDSETDENERPPPAPVAKTSPDRISRSINRGVEEGDSVSLSSSPKNLKRKRSSDSLSPLPPPSNSESPSKRQRRASGTRDDFTAVVSGDTMTDRAGGINACHIGPVRKTSSGSHSRVPDNDGKLENAGDKRQPETVRQLRSVTRKTQTKSERRANFFGKIRRPKF